MPFGTFEVVFRTPQARKKKPKKVKEQKPPAVEKEIPPEPVKPSEKLVWREFDGREFHICLVGRNISILREFLCSMHQNMNDALQAGGMSYFTKEAAVISGVIDVKGRLERFFMRFSSNDWTYPAETDDGEMLRYPFAISPSGNQEHMLELAFHCVTPDSGEEPSQADAVWLLADGGLLQEAAAADGYHSFLGQVLESVDSDTPVCLLLSQIEGFVRFETSDGKTVLPPDKARQLMELTRSVFAQFCPADLPVAILPVQLYGGLECIGMDDRNAPVLHISRSGYHQSYSPENCQIPALYTLQQIAEKHQTDFFAGELSAGGLLNYIRQHYQVKFGNPRWEPDYLNSEEEP